MDQTPEETFLNSIATVENNIRTMMAAKQPTEHRLLSIEWKIRTRMTMPKSYVLVVGEPTDAELEASRQELQDILNKWPGPMDYGPPQQVMDLMPIPPDMEAPELIANMKAYVRGHGAEYYAIIPYVMRISDEPNWRPPDGNVPGGYNEVSNLMRKPYADQSYALYSAISTALTCRDPFRWGDVYDGPSTFSALLQDALKRAQAHEQVPICEPTSKAPPSKRPQPASHFQEKKRARMSTGARPPSKAQAPSKASEHVICACLCLGSPCSNILKSTEETFCDTCALYCGAMLDPNVPPPAPKPMPEAQLSRPGRGIPTPKEDYYYGGEHGDYYGECILL